MGLNLGSIGKKIEDILGAGVGAVGHEIGQLPNQILHLGAPAPTPAPPVAAPQPMQIPRSLGPQALGLSPTLYNPNNMPQSLVLPPPAPAKSKVRQGILGAVSPIVAGEAALAKKALTTPISGKVLQPLTGSNTPVSAAEVIKQIPASVGSQVGGITGASEYYKHVQNIQALNNQLSQTDNPDDQNAIKAQIHKEVAGAATSIPRALSKVVTFPITAAENLGGATYAQATGKPGVKLPFVGEVPSFSQQAQNEGIGTTAANALVNLGGLIGGGKGIKEGFGNIRAGEDTSVPAEAPVEPPTASKPSNKPAPTAGELSVKNTPDVTTYLDRTNKTPQFTSDLESNLQKLVGTHQANALALEKLISDNKLNPADLEAAFHYGEDRTSPVTPTQRAIYEQYVAPIKSASLEATNSLRELPLAEDPQYMHRIALDQNGRVDRYLTGDVSSPSESALRQSIDATKGRTMKALEDAQGNRTVVNIDTTEDALGHKGGTKQVTAFADGQSEHLGSFRPKTQGDLMDKELAPLQKQLDKLSQQSRTLDRVRQRGGDTTAQENALARKVALIRDNAESAGRNLTPAERRSVRLATGKGVALHNVSEPTTNVARIKGSITNDIEVLKGRIQNIHDAYNPEELNNKVFTDKNGKEYTVTDATAKEVMANSKVRYLTDPIASQAIGHANAVNAKAANDFIENWKTSPDFKDHAMKATGEGTPPSNWVPAKSPYFRGYVFDPKTAKLLDTYAGGATPEPGLVGKVWNGATSVAVQAIVINPEVHGVNLLTQANIAAGNIPLAEGSSIPGGLKGSVDFARSLGGLKDTATRSEMLDNYLRAGGHFMSYGADRDTILTRAADALNLPHVSKLNAATMAGIDANLRSALYDASVKGGMTPEDAVANIDTFMGRRGAPSDLVQGTTLFYHWLKTQATGLGASVTHPVANIGATTNALAITALLYGANKAYQAFTGNPNAHLRTPGELGLAQNLIKAPGEVKQGQVPTAIQSHVNPLLSTIADQAYGTSLQTGQKLSTPSARFRDAEQRLFSPSTMVNKVGQGKSTVAEQALNELGFYTPHAAGSPAATKGPLQVINTQGAVASKTGDPTGYQQEIQYFNDRDKATSGLNTNEQNALGVVHPQKKDPVTGEYTYQPTVFDADSNSATYLRFPKVLEADTKLNQMLAKQGQSVDPLWMQSPDKITAYLQGQLIDKNNTPNMTTWAQENKSWYPALEQERSVFFNSLPPGDPNKPAAPIAPMIQTPQVQAAFAKYGALTDPTQKAQFLGAHPELTDYMTQAAERTNKVLVAEGKTPLKPYPVADPQTASYTSAYMNGDKAQRAALRNGNPLGYQAMSAYLQNVSEYEVAKNGALDQLQGQVPNQAFLKGISSLAQYNLVKNPDGTLALKYGTVNPGATTYGSVAAPPQAGAVSAVTSGGSGGKSSAQASFERRELKNAGKSIRRRAPRVKVRSHSQSLLVNRAKPKKAFVAFYPTAGKRTFKHTTPKVSLKPSR